MSIKPYPGSIRISDRTDHCATCYKKEFTSPAHGLVCNCGMSQDGWFTPFKEMSE